MSHFESLESRTFLSAAPSVATIRMAGSQALSDLVVIKTTGSANFKLIETDLAADGELKSSKKLLKTLSIEGTAAFAVTARVVENTVKLIGSDVNKVVAAAAHLSKKETSTKLQAYLTAAENTLMTDAANRLSDINTAVTAQQATNDKNVENIVEANPSNTQLASDVSGSIKTTATAARDALTTDATTALTTDVNNIILAFPA